MWLQQPSVKKKPKYLKKQPKCGPFTSIIYNTKNIYVNHITNTKIQNEIDSCA